MMSQAQKAERFRALHAAPGAFVIPNPYDAGTARLLAGLGFAALATTSAGLAFSLGRPDGAAAITREQVLANARAIVDATELPVSADLESGFGATAEAIAETIRLAAGTGLVGGSIEDATYDASRPIYELAEATERVAAAVAAARALPFPFTLTARAENYLFGRPDLDDTIRRLKAYAAAGADVLYAPGLPGVEAIRRVCREGGKPLNVVVGLAGMTLPAATLAEAGVKRISLGSTLARAALGGFLEAAREIRTQGTFGFAARAVPFAEINKMMG